MGEQTKVVTLGPRVSIALEKFALMKQTVWMLTSTTLWIRAGIASRDTLILLHLRTPTCLSSTQELPSRALVSMTITASTATTMIPVAMPVLHPTIPTILKMRATMMTQRQQQRQQQGRQPQRRRPQQRPQRRAQTATSKVATSKVAISEVPVVVVVVVCIRHVNPVSS